MIQDSRGLSLSTASETAAALYRDGVALMMAAWPGAGAALEGAIAADPGFALALAARARLHASSAEPAEARRRIAEAEAAVLARGDAREKSHVAALALAIAGRSAEAIAAVLAHAEAWPRDALVLAMPLGAFGLFAFSGMADHDQARVDLCARHAAHYGEDDWWFLTARGWALAENGEVGRGRAMIERAFALRPANANAVHALAHAQFEAGAGDEARRLIEGWLPTYHRAGLLHGHLAWHAALAALEAGEAEAALALYGAHVAPGVSLGLPINVVSDAASLLWRLEAYGHAVPEELWPRAAEFGRGAFPAAGHAFVDAHMMMLAAGAGEAEDLAARVAALDRLAATGTLAAGPVVPAIGRALGAFARGDWAGCVAVLEPLAGEVVRIGGSGAQRQVIEDTLLVALMRAGESGRAARLLARRLHRRPSPLDGRWRAGLAGQGA